MENTSTAPRIGRSVKPKKFPVLPIDQILEIIGRECAPFDLKRYGSGPCRYRVVVLPDATGKLYNYYDFGSRSPVNVYEQQSQDMGLVFDNGDGSLNFILAHMIPTPSLERGRYYSIISKEGNFTVIDVLNNEREIIRLYEKERNHDKNGYQRNPFLEYGSSEPLFDIHAHSGFECFFSEADHSNHFSTVDHPTVSIVCDPIGMKMKAMAGVEHADAEILVCEPRAIAANPAPDPSAAAVSVPAEPAPPVRELTLSVPFTRSDCIAQLGALCTRILQQPGIVGSAKAYHNFRGELAIKIKMHLTDRNEGI